MIILIIGIDLFSASLICFSKPGREGRLVLVEEKEGDRSGKERRNWECYGAPVQSGVTDGAVLEQGGSKHDDQRQSPEYGHKTTVEHTQTLIFLPFSQPALPPSDPSMRQAATSS